MQKNVGVPVREKKGFFDTREGVLVLDAGDLVFAPLEEESVEASGRGVSFAEQARRMIAKRESMRVLCDKEPGELDCLSGSYRLADGALVNLRMKRTKDDGRKPGLVLHTEEGKYRYELLESKDLAHLITAFEKTYGNRFRG